MSFQHLGTVREEFSESTNDVSKGLDNKSINSSKLKQSGKLELSQHNLNKMEKDIDPLNKNDYLKDIDNMISENSCLQISLRNIFVGKQTWVKNKSQNSLKQSFVNMLRFDLDHINI